MDSFTPLSSWMTVSLICEDEMTELMVAVVAGGITAGIIIGALWTDVLQKRWESRSRRR